MSDNKTLRILMILTSHGEFGHAGRKTGIWLESFVTPYFIFRDAGVEVTLTSPLGGMPPIDPTSRQATFPTADRFNQDDCCRAALADTLPLADIYAGDFCAAYYPEGYGAYWDLAENAICAALTARLHADGRPVALIGSAVAALCLARDANGYPLVKSRHITGLSDSAAHSAGIADELPFSLQQRLSQLGGHFNEHPDTPALQDNLLITAGISGSEAAAHRLLQLVLTSTP